MVADVDAFPGHIACAASTRSEIVVPVFDGKGVLVAVLDVDSDRPAAFDAHDASALEALMAAVFGGRTGGDAIAVRPQGPTAEGRRP